MTKSYSDRVLKASDFCPITIAFRCSIPGMSLGISALREVIGTGTCTTASCDEEVMGELIQMGGKGSLPSTWHLLASVGLGLSPQLPREVDTEMQVFPVG